MHVYVCPYVHEHRKRYKGIYTRLLTITLRVGAGGYRGGTGVGRDIHFFPSIVHYCFILAYIIFVIKTIMKYIHKLWKCVDFKSSFPPVSAGSGTE